MCLVHSECRLLCCNTFVHKVAISTLTCLIILYTRHIKNFRVEPIHGVRCFRLSVHYLFVSRKDLSERILRRRAIRVWRGHAPAKKPRGKTVGGGRAPPTKNGSDQAGDHAHVHLQREYTASLSWGKKCGIGGVGNQDG